MRFFYELWVSWLTRGNSRVFIEVVPCGRQMSLSHFLFRFQRNFNIFNTKWWYDKKDYWLSKVGSYGKIFGSRWERMNLAAFGSYFLTSSQIFFSPALLLSQYVHRRPMSAVLMLFQLYANKTSVAPAVCQEINLFSTMFSFLLWQSQNRNS